MQEQINKLSHKLKRELAGRIINDERKNKKVDLTPDELLLIETFIKIRNDSLYKIPTIIKISSRFHLDFIWWEKGVDVLLCSNR